MIQPNEALLPKRVMVDANFLVALLNHKEKNDLDLRTRYLVERISDQKCTLIIPMPALAEYLVGADEAAIDSINVFERQAHVVLAPFDRAAAFECALLDRAAINGPQSDKKDGSDAAWQKIKVDRQIVAIGKVQGALLAISRDKGVRTAAQRSGMQALTMEDLPLSPRDIQRKLDLTHTKKR